MKRQRLKIAREVEMKIFCCDMEIGTRRVDFLVGGEVVVEMKALLQLEDVHLTQAKNYLEAYNLETGLLINFGATSLQYKRIFNADAKPRPHLPSDLPRPE